MIELHRMHVGRGITDGPVTLFPVWIDAPAVAGIDWRPGSVTYRERDGGADVPTLTASAVGLRPTIALDGDLAEGGWQTRMVARSVLLGAGQSADVPVLCVEEGRWGGASELVGRARRASPAVRAASQGDGDAQGRVWAAIREFEAVAGSTPTSSLARHLDDLAAGGSGLELDLLDGHGAAGLPRPRVLDGQRGVIVGIGGRVVGAELFASTTALRSRWTGIVDGARLDACRTPSATTPAERARRFARALEQVGVGIDVGWAAQIRESGFSPNGMSVSLETRHERFAGRGIALRAPGAAGAVSTEAVLNGDERMLHLGVVDLAHPLFVLAA